MVWCGPLHLAFPGDVAYAYTNIQQVAEEEPFYETFLTSS